MHLERWKVGTFFTRHGITGGQSQIAKNKPPGHTGIWVLLKHGILDAWYEVL